MAWWICWWICFPQQKWPVDLLVEILYQLKWPVEILVFFPNQNGPANFVVDFVLCAAAWGSADCPVNLFVVIVYIKTNVKPTNDIH